MPRRKLFTAAGAQARAPPFPLPRRPVCAASISAAIGLPRIDPREAGLIAVLLLLAAAGWVFTADQMNGMDMGRWTDPGPLGFFVTTWVVMLAAMMFPSVAPMVMAYAKISRHRRENGALCPAGVHRRVRGRLLDGVDGVRARGLLALRMVASLVPGVFASDPGGRYVAAGVILAAAVYQLTPAKNVSLMKCRTPMDFILHRMRPGYGGALRMGVEHGAWCVACCWALMVALFALGVMSIGWMALVGAFIAGGEDAPVETARQPLSCGGAGRHCPQCCPLARGHDAPVALARPSGPHLSRPLWAKRKHTAP